MGRKGKQKDYVTATEWKKDYGGKSVGTATFRGARLPFNHCALTFKPINPENGDVAVIAPDGAVFNLEAVVPYITQHHTHPITGEPLELSDVTKITFSTNSQGELCCPVLGKVFNENTHIVAVRTSGNVYCWEAVDELNLKAKNMRDLLTDEKFTRKDVLTIQDPKDLRGKNIQEFDHLRVDQAGRASRADQPSHVKVVSEDAGRVLDAVRSEQQQPSYNTDANADAKSDEKKILYRSEPARKRYELVSFKPGTATWNTDADQVTVSTSKDLGGKTLPAPYSTSFKETNQTVGAASKSFTSTAVDLALTNERTKERLYLRPSPGTKGYVRLHTNLGDLNIELHCDLVPKTCENFIALAASGFYDDVPFHRSIKNFIIQGGDPTGTGTGGGNVFGTLEDEIVPSLKHDGRGVVSMANSGKDTNGSQFFVTYKSAKHLDGKHSVFGKVVGGFDVLTKMERVECDEKDRPKEDIRVTSCTVFVNPYTDMIEAERRKEKKKQEEAAFGGKEKNIQRLEEIMTTVGGNAGGGGVGKYLNVAASMTTTETATKTATAMATATAQSQQPPRKKAKPMSNFDAW